MSPPTAKVESQKTGPKRSTYISCALLFGVAGPIQPAMKYWASTARSALAWLFMNKDCQRKDMLSRPSLKMGKDQVKIALDLLVEAVKTKKVDPSRVVCISPYAANVGLIEKKRRGCQYEALQAMQPTSTVDSFQGQENDIVFVIMGTTHPRPGPDFTCNPKRLNVMLSRQKSALVIVGDINVAHKQARYEFIDESTGEKHFFVGRAINGVYNELRSLKRVVTVEGD
ncbi:hypothetical protein FPOAC1_005473 [Fusarium poae]|uniref:hypothetical protein n=1 Tax=Fusarium poae TaxID=36050 RepID=UPI001CE949F0|nr:hypothetical protein FPOAC1_005473 [Fusarium poae]KAG8672211.1 hypothetical protein FPOAC1_005473 [Fusarium poae]